MANKKVQRERLTLDLLRIYSGVAYNPLRYMVYRKDDPIDEKESQHLLIDAGDTYTLRNRLKFENIALHSLSVNSIDFTMYIRVIFLTMSYTPLKHKNLVLNYFRDRYILPQHLQYNDEKFKEVYDVSDRRLQEIKDILYENVDRLLSFFIPNYKEICKLYKEELRKKKNRKVKAKYAIKLSKEDELEIIWQCFYEAVDKLLQENNSV